jgi:uncharacterized protein YPO0396
VSAYPGYRDIHDDLNAQGLHQRRAIFVRDVNDWTGIDLLRLHGAYEEAVEEIESRLGPINDILATLAFGAGADRLHITLRHTDTADVAAFRKELKALAGASTASGDDEAKVHERFLKRPGSSTESASPRAPLSVTITSMCADTSTSRPNAATPPAPR